MTRNRMFVLIGLGVALLISGVISYYANSAPDVLEYTAGEKGFLDSAQDSATAGSPFADYGVSGLDNERLSVGLAGIIGVLVVLLLATLLTTFLKRRRTDDETADHTASGA